MAFGDVDLRMLVRLREEGRLPAAGAIAELGAQQLNNRSFDNKSLQRLAALYGIDPAGIAALGTPSHADRPGFLAEDCPLSRAFWEWLGFRYTAIDIDGTPGAIPLDLNYDPVPRRLRGRYQIVTNLGTTEHVANQFNAFKIIHDLAAPGGVMIHALPTQGDYCHGLFNYNFKFFQVLARRNDYDLLFVEYGGPLQPEAVPQDIVDWVSRYRANVEERLQALKVVRAGVRIALRKTREIPFVAPIDVDNGTTAETTGLARRHHKGFGAGQLRWRWWRRD